MRRILIYTLLLLAYTSSWSQTSQEYTYTASQEHPFGRLNPAAPPQTADFEPMIGRCECQSETRKADGTWAEPIPMVWTFKYIMNGMAVEDITWKSDGTHSGSIRQYNADSARWYVHYYTTAGAASTLPTWEGNRTEDKIVLYRPQKAPNGMDGYYRLTFHDFSEEGYKWIGEWVDVKETIIYPTWKITCTKQKDN